MARALGQSVLAVVLGYLVVVGATHQNDVEPARDGKQIDLHGSPTTMIANMARELITKSYSNSQVLSLNLSNVLILLLIKAVLFAISQYSTGGRPFGGLLGRSGPYMPPIDSQPRTLDRSDAYGAERETLLVLSYLRGEAFGNYECLNMVACEDPDGKAPRYLEAARMLLKGARVISPIMPVSPRYEGIVEGLEKAVKHGAAGGNCNHYKCDLQN
ncbi:uncharacterized protein LOC135942789 [Cloeon dipterum]|uniref:uncharacterized protein LOC135942789 n=1 Tax=Cloeon dipterum TaxID=197152 RepID=UPI00321F8E32